MGVAAGGGPRYISKELLAAEFRAQALQIQVDHLAQERVRLRAAVRDHITALPDDQKRTLARLRFLLNQIPDADA